MFNLNRLPQSLGHENKESGPAKIIPPAVETLLHPDHSASPWPESVRTNPELLKQATERRELIESIETLFSSAPNVTTEISEQIDSGTLDINIAKQSYEKLASFLGDKNENARIALYLPFEIIPNAHWQPQNSELSEVVTHFKESYMEAWNNLLHTHDIRANFVDGDIPEMDVRTGPLPIVTKAAHLIPVLVQKNLLSVESATALMNETTDETLRKSIADTLPVLADMGFMPAANETTSITRSEGAPQEVGADFIQNIQNQSIAEFAAIEEKDTSNLPEKRAKWEKKKENTVITEKFGQEVSSALIAGNIDSENIADLLQEKTAGIGIYGIRTAVESIAHADRARATSLASSLMPLLENQWASGSQDIKESVFSVWSRWSSLGILDSEKLQALGIKRAAFDTPFSEEKIGTPEQVASLATASKNIENNAELNSSVYPVSIVYGSKIKGYASKQADVDVAVFMKPGTNMNERPRLQEALSETFSKENASDTPMQFWLENNGEKMTIQDFKNPDQSLGDSTLSHVLFEGAWCGNEDVIRELHEKVLTEYLKETDRTIVGRPAREIWLAEMERDALQYRLMHRGYARSHSEQGGMKTKHSGLIDGNSAFWDSGYRRLATQLFLKKVFLPTLG